MEWPIRASWLAIAAIHAAPAAVLVAPGLVERLYGVAPGGHGRAAAGPSRGAVPRRARRGALLAAISPEARRAASLVAGISILGFLAVYAAAGLPAGPLRTVALVDLLALPPLALVTLAAWRPGWPD